MNEMLLLVLLALAFAVCLGEFCESATTVKCKCRNEKRKLLFTTSHHEVNTGRWNTYIKDVKRSCERSSALGLWRDMHDCKNEIPPTPGNVTVSPTPPTPSPPIPRTGERPSESEMIDKGYERHCSSLYKFHTKTEYWENARRTCISEGAHLAVINSKAEAKRLQRIFARYPEVSKTMDNEYALIGFHDKYNEGDFVTIFGEPLEVAGYEVWRPSKPYNEGNQHPANVGENCGGVDREGKLVDMRCYGKYAFFCELEDGGYVYNSEINYMDGYYTGVEAVIKPPPGTKKRTMPSPGYTYYPGVGFYKMHVETDSWENARRTCESEDAHLAIINSEKESAVLSKVMSKHPFIFNTHILDYAYIGFHDQFSEGTFVTIFNETLESTGFAKWRTSHDPDDYLGSDIHEGEDCGSVHRDGKLNDLSCNLKVAFICEQSLLV